MAELEAQLALDTIENLEARLQRLEFVLAGGRHELEVEIEELSPSDLGSQPLPTRLLRLERGLNNLASRSRVAKDLLKLRDMHPVLFDQSTSTSADSIFLDSSNIQQIVLASGPLYHGAASRLQSIEDTPVAPAEASAAIIKLKPRVAALALKQETQAARMAELRKRSASILEKYYRTTVLSSGQCWAEWEDRVAVVERATRRKEVEEEDERKNPH